MRSRIRPLKTSLGLEAISDKRYDRRAPQTAGTTRAMRSLLAARPISRATSTSSASQAVQPGLIRTRGGTMSKPLSIGARVLHAPHPTQPERSRCARRKARLESRRRRHANHAVRARSLTGTGRSPNPAFGARSSPIRIRTAAGTRASHSKMIPATMCSTKAQRANTTVFFSRVLVTTGWRPANTMTSGRGQSCSNTERLGSRSFQSMSLATTRRQTTTGSAKSRSSSIQARHKRNPDRQHSQPRSSRYHRSVGTERP